MYQSLRDVKYVHFITNVTLFSFVDIDISLGNSLGSEILGMEKNVIFKKLDRGLLLN